MQGVTGGAHAVALARGVIDNTGLRRTHRQQTQAGTQPQRIGGAESGRNAGKRHVVTHAQVGADTDAGKILGQAQTNDVDIVGIGQLIGIGPLRVKRIDASRHDTHWRGPIGVGRTDPPDVQPRLRQNIGGIAVVETEGAVQPLR
ncbi:hypothetical protein D3C86_1596580 [compost metagenome]